MPPVAMWETRSNLPIGAYVCSRWTDSLAAMLAPIPNQHSRGRHKSILYCKPVAEDEARRLLFYALHETRNTSIRCRLFQQSELREKSKLMEKRFEDWVNLRSQFWNA